MQKPTKSKTKKNEKKGTKIKSDKKRKEGLNRPHFSISDLENEFRCQKRKLLLYEFQYIHR